MLLYLCYILLIVGILAIVLELIMPGFDSFVSGIVGVLSLTVSAVLAVVVGLWYFVFVHVSVVLFSVFLLIYLIKRKKLHGRIVLSENLSEYSPATDLNALVGKEGKTVTSLRPYGEADFNGIRIEVSSGGAMIERDTKVRVEKTQANKVIVSVVE
jgi:membrane-bound serine protease (ClpP class)